MEPALRKDWHVLQNKKILLLNGRWMAGADTIPFERDGIVWNNTHCLMCLFFLAVNALYSFEKQVSTPDANTFQDE